MILKKSHLIVYRHCIVKALFGSLPEFLVCPTPYEVINLKSFYESLALPIIILLKFILGSIVKQFS